MAPKVRAAAALFSPTQTNGLRHQIAVQPSLERVHEILTHASSTCGARQPTLVPVCASLSAEFLTPSSIYLRLAAGARSGLSFLFESAATTETIGRFSFVGIGVQSFLSLQGTTLVL